MTMDPRNRLQGSVMVLVLVLAMSLAFLLTFLLNQGQVQAKNARLQLESVEALYEAYGELEKARRLIRESPYSGGRNTVIQDAVLRTDRRIAGTKVEIAPLTGSSGTWYSLTVRVPYEQEYERVVTQPVREVDSFSNFNLFVSKHAASVSGSPLGAIHSNKKVNFFFADGSYRHSVSSVEGVEYRSGATEENTRLMGPFNPQARHIEPDLDGDELVSFESLRSAADPRFVFDDDVDVDLELFVDNGRQRLKVETWSKTRISPWQGDRDPDDDNDYGEYDGVRYVRSRRLDRWILDAPKNGLIYVGGDVRSIRGEIVDRLTVASRGSIKITDDLRYQDRKGRTAYLNGKEPSLPYEPNPDYDNDATLGLMAYKDILYSHRVDNDLEINATMLAVTGRVGIEGVELDALGNVKTYDALTDPYGRLTGDTFRRDSIRRLGGIISAERPVETVIDSSGVAAGFFKGRAVFDLNLLHRPPPFFLTYPRPRFLAAQIVE